MGLILLVIVGALIGPGILYMIFFYLVAVAIGDVGTTYNYYISRPTEDESMWR